MSLAISRNLNRLMIAMLVLALVALALPHPVSAAAVSVGIVSVKADESVTIKVAGFPANLTLVARLDKSGNAGVNGIVIGEIKTGSGADFEATLKIPAELKGVSTISVRLESTTGGYYAYNWFSNKTSSVAGPDPVIDPSQISPAVKVIAVDAGEMATIKATGMPANVTFKVRVGPFFNFAKAGVEVMRISTGKGGTFEFNVTLPEGLKAGELVTIRLDSVDGSVKYYAYNAFKNTDLSTIVANPAGPAVPELCSITAVAPAVKVMSPGYDFDAIWTIKNTGSKNWELGVIDYKYVSGTKLHKFAAAYDLATLVKPGESIKISVDMLAPHTAGTYTTNWALVSGGTTICTLPLTITVR